MHTYSAVRRVGCPRISGQADAVTPAQTKGPPSAVGKLTDNIEARCAVKALSHPQSPRKHMYCSRSLVEGLLHDRQVFRAILELPLTQWPLKTTRGAALARLSSLRCLERSPRSS
jgi:hypothetical protein